MNISSCVSCGSKQMAKFENRSLIANQQYIDLSVHGLGGIECLEADCKEVVFNDDSAVRYSEALDKALNIYRGKELRRIRKKLGLTQIQMVQRVTGGGHNAVSRYEKGDVAIPNPLWILVVLLDKKPELLSELTHRISDN